MMKWLLVAALVLAANCDVPFVVPPFSCPVLPTPPPATNVRQLRPGNIKVVMAMGDSISAGFAMKGYPPADFIEYRDWVFSIGGDPSATTIPNWLLNYNPNLKGSAQDWTWPMTKGDWLDAAVSMAKVEALPDQIQYLMDTVASDYPGIDWEEDWKLLTIFVGANNLCDACKPKDPLGQPAYWEENLRIVLQLVQKHVPKVFVNLMTTFNLSGVWEAGQNSEYCRILWDGITNSECGCLTTGRQEDRLAMDEHAVIFNNISMRLAEEFNNVSDTFTVVVQPGLSGIPIAQYGESFLSGLDCFHPSVKANAAFTYLLWNNMMTPVGQKEVVPDPYNINIICPTEDTYLQ